MFSLFIGLLLCSNRETHFSPLFSPFPHPPAFPHPSSHQINDIHLILISSDTLSTEHLNTAHFSDISPTYSFPSTHPYPCISIISFPFSVSLSPLSPLFSYTISTTSLVFFSFVLSPLQPPNDSPHLPYNRLLHFLGAFSPTYPSLLVSFHI